MIGSSIIVALVVIILAYVVLFGGVLYFVLSSGNNREIGIVEFKFFKSDLSSLVEIIVDFRIQDWVVGKKIGYIIPLHITVELCLLRYSFVVDLNMGKIKEVL